MGVEGGVSIGLATGGALTAFWRKRLIREEMPEEAKSAAGGEDCVGGGACVGRLVGLVVKGAAGFILLFADEERFKNFLSCKIKIKIYRINRYYIDILKIIINIG